MVKLKGPGMAAEAAGGLAKTLIFSQSKGRSYLKRWEKPANPKTPAQQATRATLRFLSQEWKALPSVDQAAWQPAATVHNYSPFNAYQAFNLERWRDGRGPTWDGTENLTEGFSSATWPTPYAVSRGIQFDGSVSVVMFNWANLFYSVATPAATKTWDRVIRFQNLRTIANYSWIWRPIPTGTYYIAVSRCTIHGRIWSSQFNHTVVVT